MEIEEAESLTMVMIFLLFFGITFFLIIMGNLERMSESSTRATKDMFNIGRLILVASCYVMWQFARVVAGRYDGWVHAVAKGMMLYTLEFFVVGSFILLIEWKRKERLWKSR